MNSSHRHPNQIVMEPITRVERGGRGTNLSEPARPNRSHRRQLIAITGILIAGAVAVYLSIGSRAMLNEFGMICRPAGTFGMPKCSVLITRRAAK
jgi:hypothetical protein